MIMSALRFNFENLFIQPMITYFIAVEAAMENRSGCATDRVLRISGDRAAVFRKRSIPFCNRFVNVVSSVLGFQNPVMEYFVRNFTKNMPGYLLFNFG